MNKAQGVGSIETNRTFRNYQLHIEWKIPENIPGTNQARGKDTKMGRVAWSPKVKSCAAETTMWWSELRCIR
ncbi:MAG: hypothetical protein ABI380_15305 [Edaphobacter sp.]